MGGKSYCGNTTGNEVLTAGYKSGEEEKTWALPTGLSTGRFSRDSRQRRAEEPQTDHDVRLDCIARGASCPRKTAIVDDHHGTKIYDPYAWLEDSESAETKAFVEEQNKLSMPYLERCVLPWVKVVERFEAQYAYVTNEGSVFTLRSNSDAPRYRLVNIDEEAVEKTFSPGPVSCVNQRHLLVNYVHDVKDVLQLRELSTGRLRRALPRAAGSVAAVSGRKRHAEFFYKFSSFTTPCIIYHCDLSASDAEPSVFREVEVKGIKHEDYEISQVFYPRNDGTRIPMFLVHAKGLKKDDTHLVFLYGYGGFEASIQPYYK
ncbi:Prolyl endopeptidase [Liparis tanakae]|uniref:Prolyl endopeptidase n=1 Tax=Liparis tanakae TaxID=230148 RepID=A0A4Z2FMU0_9TELE|nr:Prolyl endopeptidase [Liparis tanakae]